MHEIEALGRAIDHRREAAGLSVKQLSENTHIPRESLRRYIATGDMRTPDLCRIALALDTVPSALWAEVEAGVAA